MITKLGNYTLTPSRPFIIAELGTLHHHDLKSLKTAARDAFNAGANAVKTQIIDPAFAFWARPETIARYKRLLVTASYQRMRDYLYEANTLHKKPVFASLFAEWMVDYFDPVLPLHKVASRLNLHHGFISMIASRGKPVLVS